MKTVCLYTHNSRLLEQWEKVLKNRYSVKSFSSFQKLKKSLNNDDYVVFHDADGLDALKDKIKNINAKIQNKRTFVLRTKPNIAEGEVLLNFDIGGYGNANMTEQVFTQAIDVLTSGNMWLYPELLNSIVKKVNKQKLNSDDVQALNSLTYRETEVANLVGIGMSNAEIADKLDISENTVKLHISSIFSKLNIKSRVGLALIISKSEN